MRQRGQDEGAGTVGGGRDFLAEADWAPILNFVSEPLRERQQDISDTASGSRRRASVLTASETQHNTEHSRFSP